GATGCGPTRTRRRRKEALLSFADLPGALHYSRSALCTFDDRQHWQTLEWHEDEMTLDPFTAKKAGLDLDGSRYVVEQDGFRLRIPLSPHPEMNRYFEFGPSTTNLRGEPAWRVENDGVRPVLTIEVEATEKAVAEVKADLNFWLGGRNRDIENGNKELRERIRPVWQAKRAGLEQRHSVVQSTLAKLNIPLHQDPNARSAPVSIKPRELRTVIEKPKPQSSPQPQLAYEDVIALVDFIEQYARQFEVSPTTYGAMSEEQLRDLLIGMMNANYPGSSTGETFNKLGKTDIRLRVDAGNVLICECKFWPGPKRYTEALTQLFSYLTWRQGANLKSCGNWAPAGARVKERRTLPAQHKTPDGEMNWRDTPWREDTTAQRRSRPRRPSTPPWKPSFAKEPAGCSPPPSRRRSARFWAEPAMSGASPSAATATGTSRSAS